MAANGGELSYQWLKNSNGITGASAPILILTNVSGANAGSYAVIVTNSLGAVTSSIVTLAVAVPPTLNLAPGPLGTIQLSANSVTGLNYVVESAINLFDPVWVPVLTNITGFDGMINFQTNAAGAGSQFYRLVFP